MKQNLFLPIILILFFDTSSHAQIKPEKFKLFIGTQEIVSSSGPGLKSNSGDILLELKDNSNPDIETLVLLRNTNGRLTKIAENANLLLGKEILGISGGNYPELSGNILSVDFSLGSNSAFTDISVVFEKNSQGIYSFKEYTLVTKNYGVENLFARQKITNKETGEISFEETTDYKTLHHSNRKQMADHNQEALHKATQRFSKFIPKGFQLARFAQGDLNKDPQKNDLILFLFNESECKIKLLLQQNDGSYSAVSSNNTLIVPGENFNSNNLRLVIKNGFFTIEQRIVTNDKDFDHRYISFKYNPNNKNWLLHRYNVEHYSGFDTKPKSKTSHFTPENFGKITFEKLNYLPED